MEVPGSPEDQARLLLDVLSGMRLGLWDWDLRTGRTHFDERWAQIVGYRLADLEPLSIRTWQDLACPEDLARSNELIRQHLRGDLPYYDAELRMRHRDGTWVWVRDRGRVVEWDEAGLPVRMSGTHEDITDRVAIRDSLAAYRRRLESMFLHHDAVMLLIDSETGAVVDANRAAAAFYGYSRETLAQMAVSDLNVLAPEEVRRLRDLAEHRERAHFVFPHRLASGEIRMVDVHSSPVEDGDRTLLFSIVRDVTTHLRSDLLSLLSAVVTRFVTVPAVGLDDAIDDVLGEVRHMLGVSRAYLAQPDGSNGPWTVTHSGEPAHRAERGDDAPTLPMDRLRHWCEELTADRAVVLDSADGLPPDAVAEREYLRRHGVASVLLLPLSPRGRLGGLIAVESAGRPHRWSSDEVAVLQLVASAIAQSLDRRSDQERLEVSATVFDTSREAILVFGPDGVIRDANPAFTRITRYPREEVVGRDVGMLESAEQDRARYGEIWHALARSGHWHGEMWSARRDGSPYLASMTVTQVLDDSGEPDCFVAAFTDITEAEEQQLRLEWLSRFDALTGLPNRREFADLVGRLTRGGEFARKEGALLLLNLDRVGSVNESYGREAGDLVVATVAARLAAHLEGAGVVARFGGNEFAILLTGVMDSESADAVGRDLLHVVAPPVVLSGSAEVFPRATVGVVLLDGEQLSTTDVLRRADAAVHQAQRVGPGTVYHFSSDLADEGRARLSMESRLYHAFLRQQLRVHYQPQVSVTTGEIVGAEALLRWTEPDGRVISPATFIPLAEETGLIGPIGLWVLGEVCRQGRVWRDAGLPPVTLAVNVSAVQLREGHLVDHVEDILRSTGFPAPLLEIELTESTMLAAGDEAATQLASLHRLGVSLAVDDFGTGYSSFASLRRLPLRRIKIDRSFVHGVDGNEDDRAIASAIIAMGHRLGYQVLAEGVETRDELDVLRDEHCDLYQGFLTSPAVPADRFAHLVARGHGLRSA